MYYVIRDRFGRVQVISDNRSAAQTADVMSVVRSWGGEMLSIENTREAAERTARMFR